MKTIVLPTLFLVLWTKICCGQSTLTLYTEGVQYSFTFSIKQNDNIEIVLSKDYPIPSFYKYSSEFSSFNNLIYGQWFILLESNNGFSVRKNEKGNLVLAYNQHIKFEIEFKYDIFLTNQFSQKPKETTTSGCMSSSSYNCNRAESLQFPLTQNIEKDELKLRIEDLLNKNLTCDQLKLGVEDAIGFKSWSDDIQLFKSLSSILKDEKEIEFLLRIMKERSNGGEIQFHKIFDAKADGDSSSEFHHRCNNKGPTIVIAEDSTKKNRFGGFTSKSWTGIGLSIEDNQAFLFSLNKFKHIKVNTPENALMDDKNFGPTFGYGNDLRILNGATRSNFNSSYLKKSYGYYDKDLTSEYFTGSTFFQLSNYEVFQVIERK